jgi:UbiD family decarboxylase
VIDVNTAGVVPATNGVAIQVRKRRRRDEEYINTLILTAMALSPRMRLVMVVDEDVDIYSADDLMWALSSRVNPKESVMMIPPGTRAAGISGESKGPSAPVWRMGIDATVPFDQKREYFRGEYPAVDLEKWLTREQITKIRAEQSEYAKVLAKLRT